jgi:alpha-amylase
MRTALARWLVAFTLLTDTPQLRADVILHAFNWRYTEVAEAAPEIAARGYRAVLVAPPLRSEGNEWWARYQPQDYRVIEHPLGDTQDFVAMTAALRAAGVETHADLLLNHMANEAWRRPDLNYPGRRVLDRYAADPLRYASLRLFGDLSVDLYTASDFHPAFCITNYNDPVQVQMGRLCGGPGDPGLPDLTDNRHVIATQRQYVQALRALGVSGFRIDAAKHMGYKHLLAVLSPDVVGDAFLYGEVIVGGGVGHPEYTTFLAPYLALTGHAAYDFPLHATLRRAFAFGGLMSELAEVTAHGQALPGDRAVTFTLTHDMPNNAGFRGQLLDPIDETLAYAFVLGRAGGRPLVYSDHNESGDGRWVDAWRRADLRAMIGFRAATAGTDEAVLAHGLCHLVLRRGSVGLVAINKCGYPETVTISLVKSPLRWGEPYRALLGGEDVLISGRTLRLQLPPRSARMWLLER